MGLKKFYLMTLLIILIVSIDLVSKLTIVEIIMLPPRTIPILPFLNLDLNYNTGLSFGLFASQFQNSPSLLITLTSIITLGLVIWAMLTRNRAEALSITLIVGGAIGNIIDRSLRNAVTDFLDFHLMGIHWPMFNLADVAIVSGLIITIFASFRFGQNQVQSIDK